MSEVKVRECVKYSLPQAEITLGEAGGEALESVVARCKGRWAAECARIVNSAKAHYARSGVGLSGETLDDVLFCYFAYGFMPDEYMCFGLAGRAPEQRREFLSNRDRDVIVYSVNDIIELERFLDKWKTYRAYSSWYGRAAVSVGKKASYKDYLTFVESHDSFVCKKVRLSKGDSIHLVKNSEMGDPRTFFDETASSGNAILEEPIVQSEVMAALNPSSVNTLRVITLNTRYGAEVLDCFLKIGRNGSFVDNGGAGGLLVGIDAGVGVLSTDGRDEFADSYAVHPNTKVRFQGYQLPDWNGAMGLAKELSSRESRVPYIGWDLAHTDSGWVVVEGNASGQLIGPQIVSQVGSRRRVLAALHDVEQIVPLNLEEKSCLK
ncbi:sugar-transfer associated ATP-grasp domain-containing protein [Adlercreutzia sp. ZJ473]|uniref:sugar-transfer associated ATP-grasp domain-containing protein n=1 Tax=Adlercreutzia sp. ZJ473 TaxID=2722822 RepID=UPI001555D0A3|nr:sugar-transfer associated ATP-grasp domain-containing protein [Adlercreutzia sp. ZJ473]